MICCALMILGVISFSYMTGAVSSIIQSYDQSEAELKEKISTLNEISHTYGLSLELFNKLAKTIRYDHSKKKRDTLNFMDELPSSLRQELAMAIHHTMYASVQFFHGKDQSFLTWITRLIAPLSIEAKDYVYKEGEEISDIFFLVQGQVGYVLPRFDNQVYINIYSGETFGHVDLGYESSFLSLQGDEMLSLEFSKKILCRRFTV